MRPPNHPIVDVKSGVVTPEWLNYLSHLSGDDSGGVTVIQRGGDQSTEPPIFITPPAGGGGTSGPVDAGSLVGTTLAPNVIVSSLIAVGTLQVGALGPGFKVDLNTVNLTGNLPWANLPMGAGIWDASVSLTGAISAKQFIGDGSGLTALPPHHVMHEDGGIDVITLDQLGVPATANRLDATTTAHGLLPRLSGVTTEFLNGAGGWSVPAGGGGSGGGVEEVFVGPADPGSTYELWYDTDDPYVLTPTPLHAATHSAGGTDPVSLQNLAGFPGGTVMYLRSDGTWAIPPGTGGGTGGGGVVDAQYWVSTGHTDLVAEVNLGTLVSGYLKITTAAGVATPSSLAAIPQSDVTNLTIDLAAKAPLASPVLTGTPSAPTATAGTNTTQLATTAFVMAAVGGVTVGSGTVGKLSKWTTTTGLGDSIVTESAGAITVAGSAVLSGWLDLLESAASTPGADTARLNAVDANGFTGVVATDSTGLRLLMTRDSVLVAKATVAITKGQVVYLSGAGGANEEVQLARSDTTATLPAIGFALDTVAVNAFVRVLIQGKLVGLDTTAWAEGTRLFVSATTAGALTATAPPYPNWVQRVAVVTRSHATQGELLVLVAGASQPVHAASHYVGGPDPITVTSLAGFPGGTTTFLRADGTFAITPSGDEVFVGTADPGAAYELWFDTDEPITAAPDVFGPASAVVGNIATFADPTGKLLQDGGKALPTGAIVGDTDVQTLSAKTLTSPVLTGTPTAPTATAGTSTTQVATTAFVTTAVAAVTGVPPSAHATTHKSGGSDAIALDTLAAPTDVTTLNATASAHGLLPKLAGNTTTFLRGDGQWVSPTGAGDVTGPATSVADNLASFTNTTGKAIKDSGIATANVVLKDAANVFTKAYAIGSHAISIQAALPLQSFVETGGAVDAKMWRVYATGGRFFIDCTNDAETASQAMWIFGRDGTLTTPRALNIRGGNPFLCIQDTNRPVDGQVFIIQNLADVLKVSAFNDAINAEQKQVLAMNRNGNITVGGSITALNTLLLTDGGNPSLSISVIGNYLRFNSSNYGQIAYMDMAGSMVLNGQLNSAGLMNRGHYYQSTGAYVYPGSQTGENPQQAWFLATHSSYGLYTNTGLFVAGPVYSSTDMRININGGYYYVLNVAGNGWVPTITVDGNNWVALQLSGRPLRVMAPVITNAIGGGSSSAGSFQVYVDGLGYMKIPLYS